MTRLAALHRLLCAIGLHAGRWAECWGWTDRAGRRRTGLMRECTRCGTISLRTRRAKGRR